MATSPGLEGTPSGLELVGIYQDPAVPHPIDLALDFHGQLFGDSEGIDGRDPDELEPDPDRHPTRLPGDRGHGRGPPGPGGPGVDETRSRRSNRSRAGRRRRAVATLLRHHRRAGGGAGRARWTLGNGGDRDPRRGEARASRTSPGPRVGLLPGPVDRTDLGPDDPDGVRPGVAALGGRPHRGARPGLSTEVREEVRRGSLFGGRPVVPTPRPVLDAIDSVLAKWSHVAVAAGGPRSRPAVGLARIGSVAARAVDAAIRATGAAAGRHAGPTARSSGWLGGLAVGLAGLARSMGPAGGPSSPAREARSKKGGTSFGAWRRRNAVADSGGPEHQRGVEGPPEARPEGQSPAAEWRSISERPASSEVGGPILAMGRRPWPRPAIRTTLAQGSLPGRGKASRHGPGPQQGLVDPGDRRGECDPGRGEVRSLAIGVEGGGPQGAEPAEGDPGAPRGTIPSREAGGPAPSSGAASKPRRSGQLPFAGGVEQRNPRGRTPRAAASRNSGRPVAAWSSRQGQADPGRRRGPARSGRPTPGPGPRPTHGPRSRPGPDGPPIATVPRPGRRRFRGIGPGPRRDPSPPGRGSRFRVAADDVDRVGRVDRPGAARRSSRVPRPASRARGGPAARRAGPSTRRAAKATPSRPAEERDRESRPRSTGAPGRACRIDRARSPPSRALVGRHSGSPVIAWTWARNRAIPAEPA